MREKIEKELARQLVDLGVEKFRINGKTQDTFLTPEPNKEREITINIVPSAEHTIRPGGM